MCLVNDEKTDALLKSRQHLTTKFRIRQSFRRNQEDVAIVPGKRRLRLLPLISVFAMNRNRLQSYVAGSFNLISHQSQERTDQHRRTRAAITQDLCRDKVNDTFAPAGALNEQQTLIAYRNSFDGFPLAVPK